MRTAVVVTAMILAFGSAAGAQTIYQGAGAYQRIGPVTYDANKSVQQGVGTTTYAVSGNGGAQTFYQRSGPTTYGSDGSSYQNIGPVTYGSDSSIAQTYGQTTYITDKNGQSVICRSIGSQAYCY